MGSKQAMLVPQLPAWGLDCNFFQECYLMLHILEAFLAELPVLDGLSTIFCHMQPPRSIPLLFFPEILSV